ncbi:MAG: hypothetical protein EAX81_02355 [Candidatus Thorarchaeota archaeon]|nr:hypothetical protein [Candidatus Thorarchaeota archaeon]
MGLVLTCRLLIPSDDADGISVADHFGRASFFVLVDLDNRGNITSRSVQRNTSGHLGGRGHAHDNVLSYSPHVVIVQGMGPRGLRSFESQDIAVLQSRSRLVDEAIASYLRGDLPELTEGCSHAHHK